MATVIRIESSDGAFMRRFIEWLEKQKVKPDSTKLVIDPVDPLPKLRELVDLFDRNADQADDDDVSLVWDRASLAVSVVCDELS